MASKGSFNKKGGVAYEKRAKIDKAQQDMLIAVGLAAGVIGFTIVGAIFFIKKINFNNRIAKANEEVIKVYQDSQKALSSLDHQVAALSTNENLESIARTRDGVGCKGFTAPESFSGIKDDQIELFRTCSSLRVISDALPVENNNLATLSSITYLSKLASKAAKEPELIGGDETTLTSEGFEALDSENIHVLNSSIKIQDRIDALQQVMGIMESSIRNFDIVSAEMSWGGKQGDLDEDSLAQQQNVDFRDAMIDFSAVFSSYYSEPASLAKEKRIVCANPDSEACTKKGGDSYAKKKGGAAAQDDKKEAK